MCINILPNTLLGWPIRSKEVSSRQQQPTSLTRDLQSETDRFTFNNLYHMNKVLIGDGSVELPQTVLDEALLDSNHV